MTRLSWLTQPFREYLSLRLSGLAALTIIFVFAAVLVSLGFLTSDPNLVSRLFVVACPVVFLSSLVLSWIIGRQLSGLQRLARLALRLREQDVISEFPAPSEDELGLLARALRSLCQTVESRFEWTGATASEILEAAQRLPGRSRGPLEEGRGGLEALETLHKRLVEMGGALEATAESSRQLQTAAAGNAAAALSVDSSIQGVASNAENLNMAVDEAAATIEQIASSIQQVAGSTGRLSGSMDEAVAVISRIETSIQKVEQDTRESSHLSEQVAQEAGRGSVAVRKTIEGMRRIRRSVQQTARVVRTLGGRSKEIGEILHVIDEIAGQTNLLAINAAIIAAQAGEQGKGFALVAEEIRDLAERTAASTKEIDNLIRTVRREAAQAVDAMEEGLSSVEEGVHLSNNAGEALERILERADSSSSTARAIAEAIQEQSFGSKKVTQEIENIRSMVKQINLATQAQAQASTLLTRVTREMKEHTADVNQATAEQVERSAALVASTSGLEHETQQIHEEMATQAALVHALAVLTDRAQESAASQVAQLSELELGIGRLMERTRLLADESARTGLRAAPQAPDT